MSRDAFVGAYRWIFGLAGVVALSAGFWPQDGGGPDPVNYFSFFTILSNLLACGLLFAGAWPWTARRSRGRDLLRGAATVYMAVTGLVYGVLLAGHPSLVDPWINNLEHRVLPVVIVLDWLIDPPRHRLTLAVVPRWLAFPVVYLAYTEIRGAFVDWYPYPFLDPRIGGYGRVALYGLGIAALFAVVAVAVAALGDRLGRPIRQAGASASARS